MTEMTETLYEDVYCPYDFPEFKENPESPFPLVNIFDNFVIKKVSKDEYKNLKFFSDISYEEKKNKRHSHFPLIYKSKRQDSSDHILIMMEKFEGDYLSIEKNFEDIDELLSLFLQLLMAVYTIDSYGKFHGDLNPGNILYKKIENSESEYLKYDIKGETYYIKHFNRLWIVLDFEYLNDKGRELSSYNENFDSKFFKRLFGMEQYNKIIKPVCGSWLYDMYVITKFTGAYKMADRIFDMMQEDFNLNPIEAIPHIIKNDISHLLLRDLNNRNT